MTEKMLTEEEMLTAPLEQIIEAQEEGYVAPDGTPIVTLPPDTDMTEDTVYSLAPRKWHWPDELAAVFHKIATGRGIKIAVGDTGYTKHVDGPKPIATKSFISGQSVEDGNGHGTHCLGSVFDLAIEAEYIVFKCLSNGGSGSSGGIAAGIRWAIDQGADVISLSLGGGGSYAPTNQAIDYGWSKGCATNAAAGNSGFRGANTIGWPAKYSNCLCCGAYNSAGQIANFSSGGNELDWACPGQDIVSFSNNGSGYRSMSGTSMATPHGSGFLGCLQEVLRRQGYPRWTSADSVRAIFKANLTDAGAPGFDPRFGNGKPVVDTFIQKMIRSEFTCA